MTSVERLEDFFSASELAAIDLLAEKVYVDVRRSWGFWEALVARITAGRLTSHSCPWDVEVSGLRVEVKSSTEFMCRFGSSARPVFKFAKPVGSGAKKAADVLVLIGADGDGAICSWVLSPLAIRRRCSSITITSPRVRHGGSKGWDRYFCPPSQILPEVLRASRCRLEFTE